MTGGHAQRRTGHRPTSSVRACDFRRTRRRGPARNGPILGLAASMAHVDITKIGTHPRRRRSPVTIRLTATDNRQTTTNRRKGCRPVIESTDLLGQSSCCDGVVGGGTHGTDALAACQRRL